MTYIKKIKPERTKMKRIHLRLLSTDDNSLMSKVMLDIPFNLPYEKLFILCAIESEKWANEHNLDWTQDVFWEIQESKKEK